MPPTQTAIAERVATLAWVVFVASACGSASQVAPPPALATVDAKELVWQVDLGVGGTFTLERVRAAAQQAEDVAWTDADGSFSAIVKLAIPHEQGCVY